MENGFLKNKVKNLVDVKKKEKIYYYDALYKYGGNKGTSGNKYG